MNDSLLKLLRYLVAYVFITSGLMKMVSTELGNYFIQLKLPFPLKVMYVVAIVELLAGVLISINKNVRLAVIPLMLIMIAAFLLTKVPVLHSGFLPFAFNARLDIIMIVLLFILYTGSPRR